MRLALIPSGEFEMGSSEAEFAQLAAEAKQQNAPTWYIQGIRAESPEHRVKLTKPFYLGICEVTQEQYQRLVGANPSKFQGNLGGPVEQVNWFDAMEFCRKLSELPQEKTTGATYRLPTEAEWEFACRAGTTTSYSFGDAASVLNAHAWSKANAQDRTQPVGILRPNRWGLFDMHGNVWEWCGDWFAADYYAKSAAADPLGPDTGTMRVLRGSSWCDGEPGCFRCAYRYQGRAPAFRDFSLGFRVARDLPDR